MPINPEDEDDVVPDMHAAFGINRALGQGGGAVSGTVGSGGGMGQGETSNAGLARESVWRDLGMEGILDGAGAEAGEPRGGWGAAVVGGGGERGGTVNSVGMGGGARGMTGARREGRRTGVLLRR